MSLHYAHIDQLPYSLVWKHQLFLWWFSSGWTNQRFHKTKFASVSYNRLTMFAKHSNWRWLNWQKTVSQCLPTAVQMIGRVRAIYDAFLRRVLCMHTKWTYWFRFIRAYAYNFHIIHIISTHLIIPSACWKTFRFHQMTPTIPCGKIFVSSYSDKSLAIFCRF